MNRKTQVRSSGPSQVGSDGQPKSKDEQEKDMWSSMLDSAATGKKLPEKNLVILGGRPETQREFLDTLAHDAPKRPQDRHKRKPVVANDFALGYTYQDVLDADHEDILARLSIYLLSETSSSFAPLLRPLFTPNSIPETLLVILLDWNEPWTWVRQLRDCILLLRGIISSLDEESNRISEEVTKEWQQRKRGTSTYDAAGAASGTEASVTLPLGQGEWDEPLGLPLCVVCHNADKINSLEIDQNWREEDFDFVLQFLRTILMKHGASLIYTSNSAPNSLPNLIHSTLGIHSMLKKQALKHNVIDRDKVLVPPNWDSWGKIRVLREGFDVEGTSQAWSNETSLPPQSTTLLTTYTNNLPQPPHAIPTSDSNSIPKPPMDIQVPPMQTFLSHQLDTLTRLQTEEERSSSTPPHAPGNFSTTSTNPTNEKMNEQIGPVQVNMGGIQMDADDIVRRMKTRGDVTTTTPAATTKTPEQTEGGDKSGGSGGTPDLKAQNEALNSFFSNLIKRGAGNNSPRSSPGGDAKKGKEKEKDGEAKRLFSA